MSWRGTKGTFSTLKRYDEQPLLVYMVVPPLGVTGIPGSPDMPYASLDQLERNAYLSDRLARKHEERDKLKGQDACAFQISE